MRIINTAAMAALLCGLTSADFLADRVLQAIPTPPPAPAYTSTTKALKYYGDDIKITYNSNLGCGACITGGYVYCVLGKEGDDYSNVTTITQNCCQNSTASACPQLSNSNYTCSNKYTDKMLAKNVCPYRSSKCGGKGSTFRFSTWGDSTKVNFNATLTNGESCSYVLNTQCGVPAFQVGDTTGFQIESIDYTDDEATRRRVLLGDEEEEDFDLFDEQAFSVDIQFTKLQTTTTNSTTNSTTNGTKTNTTTTNTTTTNTTTNGTKTNTTTNTTTNGTTGNTTTNTTKPTNTTGNTTTGNTTKPVTPVTPTPPPTPAPPKVIPNLPTNLVPPRRTVTTSVVNGTVVYSASSTSVAGPQASVYYPNLDKGKKVFKGGKRTSDSSLNS